MSATNRMRRGWHLGFQSLRIVFRDKTLLLFPLIPFTVAATIFTLFAVIIGPDELNWALLSVNLLHHLGFVAMLYALAAVISVFFEVGLVECTRISVTERDSVFTDGLQVARDESAAASFALAFLALAEWEADDVGRAAMLVEQAYAAVDRPGPRSYTPNIAAFAVAAHLRAVTGDLAGAAVAVDRANTLMPQLTIALRWLMVVTRTLLATALAALDRNTEAAAYRSEVDQLLADYEEEDGTLGAWCDATALRSDARRRRNPTARELTAAEHRVLRLLAGTLTLREIGGELYVSRNTVRTHVQSIYRKLGVSCRADAVAAAKAAATAGRVGST